MSTTTIHPRSLTYEELVDSTLIAGEPVSPEVVAELDRKHRMQLVGLYREVRRLCDLITMGETEEVTDVAASLQIEAEEFLAVEYPDADVMPPEFANVVPFPGGRNR